LAVRELARSLLEGLLVVLAGTAVQDVEDVADGAAEAEEAEEGGA
jgi:hypothetical protein